MEMTFASERLKGDYNMSLLSVLLSMNKNDSCEFTLGCVNDRLKDNEEFMLRIVKLRGKLLEHASLRLKDDYEMVMAALSQNSSAYYYASERLKVDNKIIYATAVQSEKELTRVMIANGWGTDSSNKCCTKCCVIA